MNHTTAVNPFVFGSPVRQREQFFDRESITQRIMGRLQSMGDTSVIGERRMGKTSLLYHLSDPVVAKEHGLDPSTYLFVYITFEGAGHLTPTRFWQRVLGMVAKGITDADLQASAERMRSSDEIDTLDLEDLIRDISSTGQRIVLLLDEFETVTQAVNLDADFFAHLRTLATGQYLGLIFVTSSRQKLSELSHAGIVGSPFFNIFETFFLNPFDHGAGETMIASALGQTDVKFEAREVDYLLALSGRHPFFLQIGASYMFDAYAAKGLRGPDLVTARLEYVEREFSAQVEPHLRHYWDQSATYERIFLVALAMLRSQQRAGGRQQPVVDMEQMKQAYRDADVAARVLADRGLVRREGGGYQSLSPAFERWLVQELARSGSRGDYPAWLQQNASYFGGRPAGLHDRAGVVGAILNSTYFGLFTEWAGKADDPEMVVNLLCTCAPSSVERPIWLDYVGVAS